jgi:acyl dehydratase
MAIDVDQTHPGDQVDPFVRTPGFHHWNRYAAVNSEFVGHHMDDEAGRASGYPGAFGMGNLTFAWLHCMLREWLGGAGRVVRVECQFRNPVLRGDTVTCTGVVTKRYEQDGEHRIDLEVWSENQRGEKSTPGTATVALWKHR